MVPGSHLVISQTADESSANVMGAAKQGFKTAGAPLTPRTRERVASFFDGFDLAEPGLVDVRTWRPVGIAAGNETPELPWTIVGGVGRKR